MEYGGRNEGRETALPHMYEPEGAAISRTKEKEPPMTGETPRGECLWLIEGTRHYTDRTTYWIGAWWIDQSDYEESVALYAARYTSKEAAEAVIATIPHDSGVHRIRAREHLFNCGPDPELLAMTGERAKYPIHLTEERWAAMWQICNAVLNDGFVSIALRNSYAIICDNESRVGLVDPPIPPPREQP